MAWKYSCFGSALMLLDVSHICRVALERSDGWSNEEE